MPNYDAPQQADPDAAFAANMRHEREARGWSQSQVAEELQKRGLANFHPTTISRIENGSRTVTVGEASCIADLFGWSMQYMASAKIEPMREVSEAWQAHNRLLNETRSAEANARRFGESLRGSSESGLRFVARAREWLMGGEGLPEDQRTQLLADLEGYERALAITTTQEWSEYIRRSGERSVQRGVTGVEPNPDPVSRQARRAESAPAMETAPSAKGVGKFELFQDKAGKYRFRLRAPNGQIIATGEAYESKAAAEKAAESLSWAALKAADHG